MSLNNIDLHGAVTSVLGTSEYIYKQYQGRTLNDLGIWVTTYHTDVVRTTGTVQPMDAKELQQNGIDSTQEHILIIDKVDFTINRRNQGADRCVYLGNIYEIIPTTCNWFGEYGWCESIWCRQ